MPNMPFPGQTWESVGLSIKRTVVLENDLAFVSAPGWVRCTVPTTCGPTLAKRAGADRHLRTESQVCSSQRFALLFRRFVRKPRPMFRHLLIMLMKRPFKAWNKLANACTIMNSFFFGFRRSIDFIQFLISRSETKFEKNPHEGFTP
jgi:hypothetical protein